jgi:hypothetical protein
MTTEDRPLTIEQFAQRMGKRFTLRYFKDDKNVPDPTKQWRAALAGHYYTSDTGRISETPSYDNGREGEGWGSTPDEAVTALADVLVTAIDGRARSSIENARKYESEAAVLRAKLYL